MPSITYDTWREEYGDYGPRWAGTQRNNGVGLFSADNLIVYRNGAIGPRAGIKGYTYASTPTGVVTGMFDAPFPGKTLLFTVDDDLYHVDSEDQTDTVAVIGSGTLSTTSSQVTGGPSFANHLYITSLGDTTYEVADTDDEIVAIDNSPGGNAVVLHGERLFVGGGVFPSTTSVVNRVAYSDGADFDSFGALNFFDIYGAGGAEISNLASLGSRLIIQSEDNLYVYLGVPGADQLRSIIRTGVGVARVPGALVAAGDELWFITREGTLGWSNGSVTDGDRWERLGVGTEDAKAIYDPFASVVGIFADGGAALVRRRGVWTRHTLPSEIKNLAAHRYVPGTRTEGFVLTDGGGAEAAATFYAFRNDLERPGFTSDSFANVGDNSATPFAAHLHLPEYRRVDEELVVREVKVDFVKWQTGQTATTHFDVTVRAWSLYDSDGYRDSSVLAFDEPNNHTDAGTTGTPARWNGTFGDQGSGAGFQILIDNVRACAIRSVTVNFESRPARSR